ncbi:hypothetical protein E2562_005369 [Oryza meyeriana var. granulata]|uniref:AP2/ERF domain-containing protein n=1 Tax=Oryza meyeriana var. granulata TaxID=110450 RepID=A0A6G1DF09_9ORYZ|nr:hypothetical protein E2562_005369 [Oryza meyeriana var. granulata]
MGTNPSLQELAAAAATARPRGRVVRILVRDADATDSSSSEDETVSLPPRQRRRGKVGGGVKRRVMEAGRGEASSGARPAARFRGVRERPWGRFAAEIRDPHLRRRLWLGTFDTAEEAAAAYDAASIRLHGSSATTNFSSVLCYSQPELTKPTIPPPEAVRPITLPVGPAKPTLLPQLKEEGESCGGRVKEEGSSCEVQAPMWTMISGKRKKRSGCGTCVHAFHAVSACMEEVGGA